MEQVSVLGKALTASHFIGQQIETKPQKEVGIRSNPMLESILAEGGDDFFQYLKWTGLTNEPNLMVLSPIHHYYYDHNDLKGIKTLVNLKRLNQVRHLESFLNILSRILQPGAFFAGRFINHSISLERNPVNRSVRFFGGLISLPDSNTDRSLTKGCVVKLLESYRFQVNDMTEVNSNTYFCAQNMRLTDN